MGAWHRFPLFSIEMVAAPLGFRMKLNVRQSISFNFFTKTNESTTISIAKTNGSCTALACYA